MLGRSLQYEVGSQGGLRANVTTPRNPLQPTNRLGHLDLEAWYPSLIRVNPVTLQLSQISHLQLKPHLGKWFFDLFCLLEFHMNWIICGQLYFDHLCHNHRTLGFHSKRLIIAYRNKLIHRRTYRLATSDSASAEV